MQKKKIKICLKNIVICCYTRYSMFVGILINNNILRV